MTTTTDNDLFNQISKAMQEDDSTKLSSLLAQETPEEEEQPEEELPADEPEDTNIQDEQDEPSEEDGEEQEVATEEVDPLAALRAELAELKKNQQSLSSQAGRVPSLQRKLAEYDRQLADLKKNATSGTTSDKVKPKLDEALKDLEDTDPALASAIRNAVGGALSEVDTGSAAREISRIESLREAEYAEYVDAQKEVLLNKYPNVSEVFASDSWKTWKKEQPKHVLELAGADSAEAVIMALDIYRRDMIAKHPELANQKTETAVVDERALQIEESRKKQQQRAANLDSGKPPARSKGPSDPEALFKQFSEEIRKDIRGA